MLTHHAVAAVSEGTNELSAHGEMERGDSDKGRERVKGKERELATDAV
jgi:hypothetical protein